MDNEPGFIRKAVWFVVLVIVWTLSVILLVQVITRSLLVKFCSSKLDGLVGSFYHKFLLVLSNFSCD